MINCNFLKHNIYSFPCVVSLLEGSLSGVEALRHLRLDLQAKKKVLTFISIVRYLKNTNMKRKKLACSVFISSLSCTGVCG